MWSTILEIVNKLLDLIKAIFVKDKKDASVQYKTEPKKAPVILKHIFNATDRKNFTNMCNEQSLYLAKNTNGDLVITREQITRLSSFASKGLIKGTKRVKMINLLAQIA